jgi:hypothetical protein
MNLNMGASKSNILDVFAANFSHSVNDFLKINAGTFNFATGRTITPFTGTDTIPLNGGLRINHPSAVVNTTTGGNLVVVGNLDMLAGTMNIGSAAADTSDLLSKGGTFTFSGGTVNIGGSFAPYSDFDLTTLTLSGTTLTVGKTTGTAPIDPPFKMSVAGSIFTMTGGAIIVQGPGNGNSGYFNSGYSNYSVTGGYVQIGNASTAAGKTMQVNTALPVYNFYVNGTNSPTAQLVTNDLTVLNDVTISAGTLNEN